LPLTAELCFLTAGGLLFRGKMPRIFLVNLCYYKMLVFVNFALNSGYNHVTIVDKDEISGYDTEVNVRTGFE